MKQKTVTREQIIKKLADNFYVFWESDDTVLIGGTWVPIENLLILGEGYYPSYLDSSDFLIPDGYEENEAWCSAQDEAAKIARKNLKF